jgi:hypothetical protein
MSAHEVGQVAQKLLGIMVSISCTAASGQLVKHWDFINLESSIKTYFANGRKEKRHRSLPSHILATNLIMH